MDYSAISRTIGYPCYPLDDEGTIALIEIPFTFADGDDIPAYVEVNSGVVHFFDDGDLFDHFYFRGLFREDDVNTEVLWTIAASNGVAFTDDFKIEIDAAPEEAAAAFAKYLAAMLAFVRWEKVWEASVGDESLISLVK